MSFIAACPHCQAKFTAQDHLVGKNVRCPKCNVPFRIGDVVVQAQQKAQAEREKSRKIKSKLKEDLPVARPAKPPAAVSPAPTPARSWKEIADLEQPPESPPAAASSLPAAKAAPPPQPQPATPAPAVPPHATPAPEQPIILNPTLTAAWEALPPIILATAQHQAAALPLASQVSAKAIKPDGDYHLDDSLLDQTSSNDDLYVLNYTPPSAARSDAASPPAQPVDEVIELGFEDLVIEQMDEKVIGKSPATAKSHDNDSQTEIITEVEVVEEAPRRHSAAVSLDFGSADASRQASSARRQMGEIPVFNSNSNSHVKWLVFGGGGGLAIILLFIAVFIALSGAREFEPSSSFTATSGPISKFEDPSGRISVRFPLPFAAVPTADRDGVVVRGAQLVGKSETFGAYYSDSIPVAIPPSGAKPLSEHWQVFDLPELADPSPSITSIRRHMLGKDYAVEYQLATDIQRDQPGETRILLIYIQQRMFLLIWSGEEYRDGVDNFFKSFTIGDLNFGDLSKP